MTMQDVQVGAVFEVRLGSSAATGYRWELGAAPDGIELLGHDDTRAAGAQIGDAGTQVFHLRAGGAGRFVLRFVLKRRWEAEPIETHEVEVRAR